MKLILDQLLESKNLSVFVKNIMMHTMSCKEAPKISKVYCVTGKIL